MSTMRLGLVVCTSVAAACGAATAPTDGPTPDFIVAIGVNVLAVGNSTQFGVTAFTRNTSATIFAGSRDDVTASASWASDNAAVAAISPSGAIVGRRAGSTTVRATYLGREYTVPLSVVARSPLAAQFAGTWSGVSTSFCRDLIGNTRSCLDITGTPGTRTGSITLTLIEADGLLQGTLTLAGASGSIVGGVDAQGGLVIGGAPLLGISGTPFQLRDWLFTASGGQLTGSGSTDAAYINVYGPVLNRTTYTSISLH